MIREIILIIDCIILIASLTIYILMEIAIKKSSNICILAKKPELLESKLFESNGNNLSLIEKLYLGNLIIVLFTILFAIMIVAIPTKYKTETVFQEKNVITLTDNSDTKIYGTLRGGFIYVDGEIKSETETILTIAITDNSGKVEFKYFNIAADNFSLYLTDETYVRYEEIYERKYCHVELFGATYNETVSEKLVKTKIYLPKSSLQYDNILDGN